MCELLTLSVTLLCVPEHCQVTTDSVNIIESPGSAQIEQSLGKEDGISGSSGKIVTDDIWLVYCFSDEATR